MGTNASALSDWQMHQYFTDNPDMEHVIIDSTIVRAHPSAAGASKKRVANTPKPLVEAEAGSAPKSM